MGLIQYNDGGTYDINSTINTDVWVDWNAPGMSTTVNVLSGGIISSPYKLEGFNISDLTISGGSVNQLYANDSTQVTMLDGTVGSFYANDNAQFTMEDGSIDGDLNVSSNAQFTMEDGSIDGGLSVSSNAQATINGGVVDAISNYSTQFTMSNGTVNGLVAWEGSQVTMTGGTISELLLDNHTQFTMEDGIIGKYVIIPGIGESALQFTISGGMFNGSFCASNSLFAMSGGTISGDLNVSDSQATMLGGTIGGDLSLGSLSSLIIEGFDFAIDGVPVGNGNITSILGGSFGDEPYRTLTGTLLNGDALNNQFRIGDMAQITLVEVPEPATLLMLGLGGLLIRRKRKY